ncbi:MAG TPA: hypothetical protein VFY71_09880, partial [Planctomycetota bacterium]|nr:hypothetical protein [Planctomycetota bacterium]
PCAAADDDATRLSALLAPDDTLACHGALPDEPVPVLPGDEGAQLLLGPGWHGREDGRWAFPGLAAPAVAGDGRGAVPLDHWTEPGEASPLPCRWTSARAELRVPVPPAARRRPQDFELRLELFVPPAAAAEPLRLALDGSALEPVSTRGAQLVARPLPHAPGSDLVPLRMDAPTHRPDRDGGSADRRELGVLVRSIAILPRGGGRVAGLQALLDRQHALRARGRLVPMGRGAVLRGDGTPLAALALLNAWLAGEVAGAPAPPDPPRDARQGCLVTALEGGLLVHNPHPVSAVRPQITGTSPHATRRRTVWNSLRPWSMLGPLQTRFVV